MATGRPRLRAALVLDGDGRALAGTLRGEDGVDRRFAGWMELAAAIEAWRADAGAPGDDGSTAHRPPRTRPPTYGGR